MKNNNKFILEGVFTVFNEVNRGRIYPADAYLVEIEHLKKKNKTKK